MPINIKKPGKLETLVTSGLVAALLGVIGIGVHREIRSRQEIANFLDEWHQAPEYNPKVVLLIGSSLENELLDEGFGVCLAYNRSSAIEAIRTNDSISAIVIGQQINLKQKDVRISEDFYLPKVSVGRGTIARLRKAIDHESDKAHKLLRMIAGYYETTDQINFHQAPRDVSYALHELFKARRFLMRRESYDAHRGGVISSLTSGVPINKNAHYNLDGICLKHELVSDLPLINDDYEIFEKMHVQVARPRFYSSAEGDQTIVLRNYFIGPTLGHLFSTLNDSDISKVTLETLTRRTINAVFSVAARYHNYKREDPITDERVNNVIGYYKTSFERAYDRLADLIQEPVSKEELIGLLDFPFLCKKNWYTTILDISLPNIILGIGIEDPDADQLISFFTDRGKVLRESDIGKALRFCDQGYRDRHIVDSFARAGFSAYIADYKTDRWIDFATSYFLKEYSASTRIPIAGFKKHMINLSTTIMPHGIVTPGELAENFFAISCYKIFRLIDDAVSGAQRNEMMYAQGEISPQQYVSNRDQYMKNAAMHAEGLSIVALTGAEYFENFSNSMTFKDIFNNMKNALRAQKHTDYKNDFSRKLYQFHLMGRQLCDAEESINEMLSEIRGSVEYPVRFKEQVS